ncbi:unnamed protein product [Musa banksii]
MSGAAASVWEGVDGRWTSRRFLGRSPTDEGSETPSPPRFARKRALLVPGVCGYMPRFDTVAGI